MTKPPRYYVGREECWGGTYLYFVRDRERTWPYQASVVGKRYKTERGAKSACIRANADFDRLCGIQKKLPNK
jgi:hypothetical protein